MLKQHLHESWTVRPVGDLSELPAGFATSEVAARVPGCVHTDLLRAGLIPDPYADRNEHELQWIGRTDWEYRTTFRVDDALFERERIDLVFDGLDTVATIILNDTDVGRVQNMHRGYRFDAKPHLRRGGANELRVVFASPVRYAEAMAKRLHIRPYCNGAGGPFNFIRKMACNFGWDWGPALPTSGIWRNVYLEGWRGARLGSVRPVIKQANATRATVDVHIKLDGDPNGCLVNVVLMGEGQARVAESYDLRPTDHNLVVSLRVEKPRLWWPRGHGESFLHELVVGLRDEKGYQLDDGYCVDFGLRTVELDTSPDQIGRKFVLKVNGKPIFCKGFNWIPDDCFLDRACEPKRVRERIQQAVDANANMLRVWGGGIYETDDFYNICDELGVLVWQDFPFACAMYPEEEPFWSEVEAEARYNVARLAHHPSLTIWNGCNENVWAYRDWGWGTHEDTKGRTWGKGYYFDLLPRVCRELTPTVPYWAASPWSGDTDVEHGVPPNADTHGNMHVWKPWNHANYDSYREFQPRFASEFGFQAPATYASIARMVPPETRDFGHPQMRHRQKSGDRVRDDGDRKNLRHLIEHFNLPGAQELYDALEPPDKGRAVTYCGCEPLAASRSLPSKVNFDDLHYLMQVNQARALTFAVEWWRSRLPRCMGTLYWQLNDCWLAVSSWAAVDGDGRRKPLWYATRRFFDGQLLTIQPDGEGLSLVFVNDSDERLKHRLGVVRWNVADERLADQWFDADVEPRSIWQAPIDRAVATPGDRTREFLTAGWAMGILTHGDVKVVQPPTRTTWFFVHDREFRYPEPKFEASVTHWPNGKTGLAIWAHSLIRDLCLFVDRLDPTAAIDDQVLTLLPNESVELVIASERPLTVEELTSPPVFRCVNPFGAER